MGTMTKLRENTGVILWILVFAFGVIWVLQDSGGLDAVGSGAAPDGNIIVVDGDPISAEEFSQSVEAQLQQYQNQTGQEVPPQLRDQVRERVFNALVVDRLRRQEMERLGIDVTDDELAEMVLGSDPHPLIKTYFADSTGQVNRQLLNSFVNNPDAQQQWIQMEQFLRQQRRQEKLDNLLAAAVHVSEQDVEDLHRQQNLKVDTRYVALPYAEVPSDEVEITDEDLRAYYDEHREDYRRRRTYTVSYVAASKAATAEDTAQVRDELEGLRNAFASAQSDSLFLARNASERAYSSAYFSADELETPVADAVFENPEEGRLIGPLFAGNLAHLVKITGVRPAEQPAVHARHLLIQGEGEEARQRAQELKEQIQQGADFAAMARQHSEDPGSASRGGDLGWFGRGQMTEAFEEAAFDAPVGEVVGPVETEFGYHLIQVEARADQEVQLADLALSMRPSVATLDDIEQKLGDVAYYADESGDFAQEAQRQNLPVQTATVETGEQGSINVPQLGPSRSITTFLEDAEEGDVSEVIELNDQFVVLRVDQIQPAGYRSFEDVKSQLRPLVLKQKRAAIQRQRLEQALEESGGFEGLADALGVPVQTQENITFTTRTIPGLGNDQVFVGTALGLDEGEVSRVIEGENAAFVVQTTRVEEPPPLTEAQRAQLRQQLLNRRRAALRNQWIASLRENADIQDNRALYQQ